ncbi:MAG: NADH-quinone oxidoreductase subunit G [Actinobacteria bacterium]|uniref:NADH-quinone oxidoreductase subunit G n=1 Tax=Candidatus Fonsibacter lacus TaxID=2576439 RepID=A0A965GCA9_9PROT|nr:NADH-quinone oxidoreductase subunit G [Candidatus Fonsibacter lacus]
MTAVQPQTDLITSEVAHKAQEGVMEFLLVNHPLDCPVCDKGGECPLQNQAMSNGRSESRFEGKKRTFEKPIHISSQVLLDRERCILCARCTRFSKEIAGDPFIDMGERGALQQVSIYEKDPFDSYFSGNTVQICPVGALTGSAYRFRSRPFDLVSTPTVCEHCASGCSMRTDVRRNKTLRRLAGNDPEVNEEWNCDKGRWAFQYTMAKDRIAAPLIRENGVLREASWPEALAAAAAGLKGKKAGVLVGGRATVEDAYAYAKFARVALGTNDIDFRSRPHSDEERSFLASQVVGSSVRYSDIDSADHVVLVGIEPEEESPIVFLRIRKQVRQRALAVTAIAPWNTRGFKKLHAKYVGITPGLEAGAIAQLSLTSASVIVVGERLCESTGALSAVADLVAKSGAKIAWVPRRAGERGALEAGAIGNLLPGGRPVSDAAARVDVAAAWSVESLPSDPGLDSAGILAAAAHGSVEALVVGGVDPFDMHAPEISGLDNAFVLSLEMRPSAITERADVVLPIAAVVEKSGSFMSWEGRVRAFEQSVPETPHQSDLYVLALVAEALGTPLGFSTVKGAAKEFGTLAKWDGARASFTQVTSSGTTGAISLATWRQLLDNGTLQVNEPNLAGTARKAVARINKTLAASLIVSDGDLVTISTDRGALSLNVEISDVVDNVVWLPRNGVGAQSLRILGALNGADVKVRKGL